jgi:hypothetical protein
VWYTVDSVGVDPALVGKTAIPVSILSTDSASDVATATVSQINIVAGADVTASLLSNVITLINDNDGLATQPANGTLSPGFTIDVIQLGFDPDIEILIPGSSNNTIDIDAINLLGTLIVNDGDSVWVRIDRNNAKIFNTISTTDSSDTISNGKLFITTTANVPYDQDVFVLWTRSGNNILVCNASQDPRANTYDEFLEVVSTVPGLGQILGPIVSGTIILIPRNSRNSDNIQEYIVGSGMLEVFYNGQYLRNGYDWEEVGDIGALSRRIKLLRTINTSSTLGFRIDANGAVYFAAGSSGGGSLQDAYDGGRFVSVVVGQPIVVSGASGKLMSIQGDLEVTGVIDPTALILTPQASTPLGATDKGVWVNTSGEFIYEFDTTQLNINADLFRVDGSLSMQGTINLDDNDIINNKAISFSTQLSSPLGATDKGLWVNSGGELIYEFDTTQLNVNTDLFRVDGSLKMQDNIDLDDHTIINCISPSDPGDVANKSYVDDLDRYTGTFVDGTNNTGLTISAGSVVIFSQSVAGEIELANASAIATCEGTVGVVVSNILDGDTGKIQVSGEISVLGGPFDIGKNVYVSSSTPGIASKNIPTGTGKVVFILGVARTTNTITLSPTFINVNENIYDEYTVGPFAINDTISLPNDSRDGNSAQQYVVGSGVLELYHNGQYLTLGKDWEEIGTVGANSSSIKILRTIQNTDTVVFRMPLTGKAFFNTGGTFHVLSSHQNGTLSTIAEHLPVHINTSGDIEKVDPTYESHALTCIGLTTASISSLNYGDIISSGRLLNVTTTASFGDVLYISKSGTLTNVKPSIGVGGFISGDWIIRVGVVCKNNTNPTNKDVMVHIVAQGQL